MRIIALDFDEVNIGESFWFINDQTGEEEHYIKIAPDVYKLHGFRNAHLFADSDSAFWFENTDCVTVKRV